MGRRLLLILALLPAFLAQAGEPYFCTESGRTLYYERVKADSGRLERTTTFEIGPVVPAGAGRRVDYSFTLRRPGGGELYGGTAPMSVQIDDDGCVRMNIGATLAAMLRGIFPRSEPRIEGTAALLPEDMEPGDRLPDAHCTVSAGAGSYRIDVTERQVLRRETLTVPAGTFDCMVVREHKVERGPGRHRDTVSDSWYVRGIGYVRHDTYDRNLRLETTEVLKNY